MNYIDLEDDWVLYIEDSVQLYEASPVYYLGHKCTLVGKKKKKFTSPTPAMAMLYKGHEHARQCCRCQKSAPEWATGFLNLCRGTERA